MRLLTGSASLYATALERLPGGSSRATIFTPPVPPYAVRGSGFTLVDADGREVIDLQGNQTTLVHGNAHPAIVAAVAEAAARGTSFGLPTAAEVELAGALVERIPCVERVRFANSGTEAVMLALRVARAYTGRTKILRFAGAYHGTYDDVLDDGARGVPPGVWDSVVTVSFGDEDAFRAALSEHGEELACVLVDLMPNRIGLVPASEAFARLVRDETAARGVLLVVDEVITFRLATGGLHSLYGISPDLVTLGKTIGGGLPVGAYGGRADVMAVTDPREDGAVELGGTFNANPLTMRAGLTALRLLDADAIARINRLGDALRAALKERGYPVNGRGSLLRIHAADALDLWWRLYREGVLIARGGLAAISTPMDESTIGEIVRRFDAAGPPRSDSAG
jgi:glutamate-1-semialdehyde 2,1-aminomutase